MEFSHRHSVIDRQSYVTQYLSLAIFVSGIVSTLGSDDLLAVFAAGGLPTSVHLVRPDMVFIDRMCHFMGW